MKPESHDGALGFYFLNRLCWKSWLAKMIFLWERKCQAFPLVPDGSIHRDLMGLVYITGKSKALPQAAPICQSIPEMAKTVMRDSKSRDEGLGGSP